ncbi:precorrin-6y C5,15-methyltransferase (decarboxylating) subunit CbiE [Methylovirgula sp. HY1]|uniref:precorrin-6y C5,15-methyltransferase (decarboxylating) subunit CbiE n=1 Tax=Methylovirgula sp. HY1 TaxID=2822761 RepID=UPI0021031E04|nr:precorrin-6y C5,15-methyltransferase (decarboxylating) subunit CbiE [Methylovirgula sp. HY1]
MMPSATMQAQHWLTLIGMGEDGRDGLSPAADRLIGQARFIIGGARHLALLGPVDAKTMEWPTPFEGGLKEILGRRGTPVCVLASGDPFLYGVGSLVAAHVPADEMICLPAVSSLSLAAARLGWALQACEIVSLHGRPFARIVPHLRPKAKLLVISWDGTTPGKLAQLLKERRLGRSRMIILEALGGPREKISETRAENFEAHDIDSLNLIALEIEADHDAVCIPLTSGLPDEWFEHDGQITKRDIRALTLSALAPWPGACLWDIGAGSGSIGIEWMLAHPRNRAVAVEAREDRAARILRNAAALGTPDLAVTIGRAPEIFAQLPQPDAIFIGGGGAEVIDAAYAILRSGGNLVVNAVTLETQSVLAERHARHGGRLTMIDIAQADPLAGFRVWHRARPIVQWALRKI